jgi:hypothetical protein
MLEPELFARHRRDKFRLQEPPTPLTSERHCLYVLNPQFVLPPLYWGTPPALSSSTALRKYHGGDTEDGRDNECSKHDFISVWSWCRKRGENCILQ